MKILSILALLAAIFFALPQTDPEPIKIYRKDGIAVKSYDFARFKPFLQKDNDTIYVINFWATWCAPCIKELPNFEKVASDNKNEKVKVILVSLDMAKQVEGSLIPFIKKRKLQSKVIHLHDPNADAWIAQVSAEWSGALPATVIYQGSKRNFYEKEFTYGTLSDELNKFK
ncbi:MAG TPA: TlpA family protein disulfide reductase [Flavobacterium sp.]|jgi:thiol-disulfide isomerase/thioredoxin